MVDLFMQSFHSGNKNLNKGLTLPFFKLLPQTNARLQISNAFCEISEVTHSAAPNTIFFL